MPTDVRTVYVYATMREDNVGGMVAKYAVGFTDGSISRTVALIESPDVAVVIGSMYAASIGLPVVIMPSMENVAAPDTFQRASNLARKIVTPSTREISDLIDGDAWRPDNRG